MKPRRRAYGVEVRPRVILLLALLALAAPATAHSASPDEIVAFVDAQRRDNGIPGLKEDPDLSRACERHNRYLDLNPEEYPHQETPGRPGYTSEGARIAPLSLLAAGTGSVEAGVNAFEYFPFHLMALLRPALRVTGASESYGWTCIVVGDPAERRAGADLELFSYPGPGRTGVRYRETEGDERPYAPGDLLGYERFSPTGPHVYLFGQGPQTVFARGMRVLSAKLTGPSGNVPVRWIDAANGTVNLRPQTALLVAPDPIPPGAYCATATVRFEGFADKVVHRVPFTTVDAPEGVRPPSSCVPSPPAGMRVEKVRRSGRKLEVRVSVSASAAGRFAISATTGPKPDTLRRIGPVKTVKGRKVSTFSGTLKPSPGARWTTVDVRFKRSDGGPGSADGRTISAPK